MLSRRFFLQGSALIGCSAAAHPLMSSMTFAATPGENRLVVVILRGAMDGLDIVQPYGDPMLAKLRPDFAIGPGNGAHDLDGFYALHPALSPLLALWRAGELSFAHAVSTPYRGKRSHFDGQDILEAGTGQDVPPELHRTGWLNRLLHSMPDARADTAFSVGTSGMPVLAGEAPTMSWSPEASVGVSDQGQRLFEQIYHDDPLFRDAARAAFEIGAQSNASGRRTTGAKRTAQARAIASFAAGRLRGDTRIAAFSINGWDTHRAQISTLRTPAERLAATITTLKDGLGDVWGKTVVLAMTEFGRTAAQNGSGGTDHGTGGALVMAGGAVSKARVHGHFPGLREADLLDRRDLMPQADIRSYAAWAIRGMFGVDRAVLEGQVFPGLDMGPDPKILA
ncbi:DUF1501 domain-containing protein [Rhodobacteraceae bacterium]|nr:DUF1501 domain-containing protein [Paracoccaceae bacterium]